MKTILLLNPVIDQFLMSMNAIKGIEWRIKLFEQLPEFIIRICLEKLSKFESISNQANVILLQII